MYINWSKVVDTIQVFMVGVVLTILTVCIVLLLAFDSVVGAGAMFEMTQGIAKYAIVISLVTTGLQTAIAFMAYLSANRGLSSLSWLLVGMTGVLWVIDIYFDSLTADILRYGTFIQIGSMVAGTEKTTQILFRTLIGGTSSIGEFLGIAIIVGMPELKQFITNAIPKSSRVQTTYTPPATQTPPYTKPNNVPVNLGTSRDEKRKAEKDTIARLNASRKRPTQEEPDMPEFLRALTRD